METTRVESGSTQISTTFFGRVMMLFGLALGVSALGTYIGFNQGLDLMIAHPGYMWAIFAAELILIFTSRIWQKMKPLNYILFSVFAFLSGVTLAPIIYMYMTQSGGGEIVFRALTATMLTFAAAGLVAWKTNIDMFRFQGLLFFGVIGLIVVGLLGVFFPFSSAMEGVYSFFGIMIFTGFVMFDMQRVKYAMAQNEMDLALQLYLDIFNLFLYILRFISRDR